MSQRGKKLLCSEKLTDNITFHATLDTGIVFKDEQQKLLVQDQMEPISMNSNVT